MVSSPLVSMLLALGAPAHRASALDGRFAQQGAEGLLRELDALWTDASRGAAPARSAAIAIASWLHARRASSARVALQIASEGSDLTLAAALLVAEAPRRSLPRGAWRAELTLARHIGFVRSPWRMPHPLPPFVEVARRGAEARIHLGQLDRTLRLLHAPGVTRRTVVGLATQRPLAPEIASALAAHPRWWAERAVRDALLANPFAPTTLILPLLPLASRQDLLRFCERSRHDAVARAARLVLEVRDRA